MSIATISRLSSVVLRGVTGPIVALFRHWELIKLLVRRDFAVRTSGTSIGALWLVAQPALQVVAFWFLLDIVLRVRMPGRVAFVDYFLVGMIAWLMVAEVLNRSLSVLIDFSALYQRSQFPIEILPLIPLLVAAVPFALVYAAMLGWIVGPGAALEGALLLLGLAFWLVPLTYLFAIIGLFVKDLAQTLPFLITMAMYLTPIMYMPEMVPEALQPYLVLNPMADLMAVLHGLVMDLPWDAAQLLRPLLLWLLLMALSWGLFQRLRPHMREAL